MKNTVYFSLFDRVGQRYGNPFPVEFVPSMDAAIQFARRSVADAVNDKQTLIGLHPADFQLFRVGEFDVKNGVFVALDSPEFICDVAGLVAGE